MNNSLRGDMMSSINKKLEKMAKDILLKNDMLKLPVDLFTIAESYNIEVYYQDLPRGISGAIKYNEDRRIFQIVIEAFDHPNRQRFTLAHELAHFFLQGEELLQNQEVHFDTCYRKTINKEEEQVEYLAGALLMDKEILTKLYKINPSIAELAETFKVSESAMTVRLMVLGLI